MSQTKTTYTMHSSERCQIYTGFLEMIIALLLKSLSWPAVRFRVARPTTARMWRALML